MSSSDSLLPPNASALETALARLGLRLEAVDLPIADLWNPATCPITALPWLAWTVSVDAWDADWSEARKRAAVASAIARQRRKGSVMAVRDAIGAIDALLELVEIDPRIAPHAFQVRLPVVAPDGAIGGQRCSAATTAQIVADVARVAPVRSQLELVLDLVVQGSGAARGAARIALYRRLQVASAGAAGINWPDILTDENGEPLTDDFGEFIDGSA